MSIPKAHPAKCGTRPGEKASTYFIPSRSSKQQQQQQNRHEMVKPSRIRVRSVAPDSNEGDPRDTFLIYSENVARTSRDRLCAVRSNGADKQKQKKTKKKNVGRRLRVVYFRSEQMEGGGAGVKSGGGGGGGGGGAGVWPTLVAGGLYEWGRESVRRQCDTVIPCSKDLFFFFMFL